MTDGALADACALVALFADSGARMTAAGRAAIQAEVFISPVTVWELTRKASLGLLPPLPMASGSFSAWLAGQGFVVQPLNWADTERANTLPPHHKDPMDRMLIAQALNARLPVITQDRIYTSYGVTVIW